MTPQPREQERIRKSARQWMADCRTAATYQLFHFANRFLRPMTLGARAVVLDGNDRVFLVRHTYVPGWHLPGGGVEAGESALEAMIRELREEARLTITQTPGIHGIFFNNSHSSRDHVVVFIVRDFTELEEGPSKARTDFEIADRGFFALNALPEGTTGATRRRLAEVKGSPRAETW